MTRLELTIGDVDPDRYAVARRLVATAFAGEPFATGMFGESPLARFVGIANEYEDWPHVKRPLMIGVDAGNVLVAVALCTFPGECNLCSDGLPASESAMSTAADLELEFQRRCRDAHLRARLPSHARICTVAVDTFLHGVGVGRRLMEGVLDRLREVDTHCVVVECLTSRQGFYAAFGFRRVAEFEDPGVPGLYSVLMLLDL